MHKLAISLVVASLSLVCPCAALSAQGISLGLKLGVSGADISFEPAEATSLRVGFVGGAGLAFAVHPAFAIQLEALYAQKGAEVDFAADGVLATLALNYFEIPIVARVTAPTAGSVRPVFYAGPAVSFEASCGVSGEADGVTVDVDCDSAVLDGGLQRKKTDFGIIGGAGLDVDAGPVVVTFEGRYNLGLVNLDDTGSPGTSAKTRTFSLLTAVAFRLPT